MYIQEKNVMSAKITGLSSKQVSASRKIYGINQMPRPKSKTEWDFFAEQNN